MGTSIVDEHADVMKGELGPAPAASGMGALTARPPRVRPRTAACDSGRNRRVVRVTAVAGSRPFEGVLNAERTVDMFVGFHGEAV